MISSCIYFLKSDFNLPLHAINILRMELCAAHSLNLWISLANASQRMNVL